MTSPLQWISFPDERLEVMGLPWFSENAPDLSRLPRGVTVPQAVQNLARFPAGGRIRICSSTTQLHLRVAALSAANGMGIDVFVDGVYWRSLLADEPEQTLECFTELEAAHREVTLYLPYRQELRVLAVGIDRDASFNAARPFSRTAPLVLYGSSIAQGATAYRPSMSYIAALARRLNLDFVNLGFGGAGKAEPEVVELVTQTAACGYVFDLGKSYGMQSADAYAAMLDAVRSSHPEAPILCISPIFATREFYSPQYVELSLHTREAMRRAATERVEAGDDKLFFIEGTELLGPSDTDGFSMDGVHPNDLGHSLIADRIHARMADVLLGGGEDAAA